MKKNKYIKEIAERLPPVYEQTVSGYKMVDGKAAPNIVHHPINHERRIRKAYASSGMSGIYAYLESINRLQIERRDRFNKR